MTQWFYLSALIFSLIGTLLIDYRYRLFFFAHARRAWIVTAVGTAFFLLWDAAGIVLGIFRVGDSPYASQIMLAPHMPLEEPVFLVFLVILTMVIYTGVQEILRRRAQHKVVDSS